MMIYREKERRRKKREERALYFSLYMCNGNNKTICYTVSRVLQSHFFPNKFSVFSRCLSTYSTSRILSFLRSTVSRPVDFLGLLRKRREDEEGYEANSQVDNIWSLSLTSVNYKSKREEIKFYREPGKCMQNIAKQDPSRVRQKS